MWLADGSNETILANTSNVGIGGINVNLDQDIEVGTRVDIQLNFSNPSTAFRCHGAVVRAIRESKKFYNIAIQFDPLDEVKGKFLEHKVSELIALEQKGKS
jgi:hypothetical protein